MWHMSFSFDLIFIFGFAFCFLSVLPRRKLSPTTVVTEKRVAFDLI